MSLEDICIKASWYFHSEMQPRNIMFSKLWSVLCFSVVAILFSHFFVPIELSNLNLKLYCLFTLLHRILFMEENIVNF